MYCPPTIMRIVSRDPMLILAIVSNCFIGSTDLKVRILCQDLIHNGFRIDLAVSDRSLTVVSPPPIDVGELNLPTIVRVSGIDQNACNCCHGPVWFGTSKVYRLESENLPSRNHFANWHKTPSTSGGIGHVSCDTLVPLFKT